MEAAQRQRNVHPDTLAYTRARVGTNPDTLSAAYIDAARRGHVRLVC